ncbi:hypothetical protein HYC85_002842 [Camellia sinensis]|uniref:Polysaccharide biosynthesis protein C-terminal domain-containing protein n=1 Tax=Camellia sinensis TaxID=4442 RepID=A0A7J7I9E7_CAMSI|nr:hypothetical protein HYC85_002842 [Camellia sinensis]
MLELTISQTHRLTGSPTEFTHVNSLLSHHSFHHHHHQILLTFEFFTNSVEFKQSLVSKNLYIFQSTWWKLLQATHSNPSPRSKMMTPIRRPLGLIREIIVASVFGIGPVATAFKYAYVLPGFSASLLGVLLHLVEPLVVLMEYNYIMQVGGLIGALVLVTAEFIIHLYAPGLWVLAEGRITREIACAQLKIMIPCIVLAGPIGLGFGYMRQCFTYAFARQLNAFQTGDLLFGGILVSCGASLGVFLQWVIQVIVLWRRDYSMIPLSWLSILEDKDVHAFFSLLLPATISLAFAHIASFTDLCFSSLIPGATAGLSYALGSPFYIVRELLVVVFYALGDGKRPFLVSVGATALNATLDWLFISKFYFGAQGLALSTSFTTALSVLILFHLLQKKLSGVIDYAALLCPLLLLLLCCILSGFTTTVALQDDLQCVVFRLHHKIP